MIKAKLVFCLALGVFALPSTQGRAGMIVDQIGAGPNLIAAVGPGRTFQQEVTAGVSGDLVGVSLWSWGLSASTSQPITVGINYGSGWQTDAAAVSQTFAPTASNQRMLVDFSATPLFLNAGDSFVITLSGTSPFGYVAYGNDDYAGHSLYFNGSELASNDLHFLTHMNVASSSTVPEPGSLAVFGAGALLVLSRRGRKRSTRIC
ncbi:MAG: PEP-CTERM sorting domain-containing protein [Planctomycetota bacterium]